MCAIPHVLHGLARPIGLAEFTDALRATCKPRFSEAPQNQVTNNHRRVGKFDPAIDESLVFVLAVLVDSFLLL